MPHKRHEQSKGTPARRGESTDSAAGAKALRRRILRELPAAADVISKAHATDDTAQVHMVVWLGRQMIPFNKQPPEVRKTAVVGHPDSFVTAALSLRDDFCLAWSSWEDDVAAKFTKAALELIEIEPIERFVKTNLTALGSEVKAREKKKWKVTAIPGWLIAFPESCERKTLLPAIFRGQLRADEKAAVLRGILARIDEQVENAETQALEETRILLAKRARTWAAQQPPTPGHQQVERAPSDAFEKRVGDLMEKYPRWSNERILGKYDVEGGEVPDRWKQHNHRDGGMLDVLHCDQCKHPLEAKLARVRRPRKLQAKR